MIEEKAQELMSREVGFRSALTCEPGAVIYVPAGWHVWRQNGGYGTSGDCKDMVCYECHGMPAPCLNPKGLSNMLSYANYMQKNIGICKDMERAVLFEVKLGQRLIDKAGPSVPIRGQALSAVKRSVSAMDMGGQTEAPMTSVARLAAAVTTEADMGDGSKGTGSVIEESCEEPRAKRPRDAGMKEDNSGQDIDGATPAMLAQPATPGAETLPSESPSKQASPLNDLVSEVDSSKLVGEMTSSASLTPQLLSASFVASSPKTQKVDKNTSGAPLTGPADEPEPVAAMTAPIGQRNRLHGRATSGFGKARHRQARQEASAVEGRQTCEATRHSNNA